MKVINISPGVLDVNPYNVVQVPLETFTFPGGEPHVKLDPDNFDTDDDVVIVVRLTSTHNLVVLALVVDALRRLPVVLNEIALFSPYFPGARQDAVMNPGEPLTVKVYADMINAMKFDHVAIVDPHSQVTPALINNCTVIDTNEFVVEAIDRIGFNHDDVITLIAPDAGSEKRVNRAAKALIEDGRNVEIIAASKIRDLGTGRIERYKLHANKLTNARCVVIDDICDGGATFNLLAKEAECMGCTELYLVVTHGIFSKGFKELAKHYKGIYTTSSIALEYSMEIPEIEKKSEIVTVIQYA